MEKLIRDGKVAVMFSPDYGAGWSSWNREYAEVLAMDKEIAEALEADDKALVKELAERKCPDAYLGGLDALRIEWLLVGTKFEIDEYDGYESIRQLGQIDFMVA